LPDHGRVTAYALASILLVESVLDPALEAPLADADLLSRVAIVLERTIGSGSEYLTDMVSLRVSDHLLAEPEKWEAFRRFAGPGLAKDIEDRSQYFG
jgi:hypothetical protein